jgi:putative hydrolase of the HAD superfamily
MKPHPEIYRHILGLLSVPAAKAVFVGDRPENDIAGANEAGLISVLIDPPHLARPLNSVAPDFTITRLGELLQILEQLEESEEETDG